VKKACLEGIDVCRFSYFDGSAWLDRWEEEGDLPRAVKINFRYRDESREREFVVNIPISP
jgi:hypothetical protein